MSSRWLVCPAHAVFALLLTFSAVNLTVPGVVARTVAESTPETDDDEDREAEVALSTLPRHATAHDRTTARVAHPLGSIPAGLNSPLRTTSKARIASADPLGARLRC